MGCCCDRLCIDECCFLMPLTHTAIWFTALLNVACYCLDPHTTIWVTVVSDYTLFFCLIIITITVPYTMTKVNCPITPMTIISASACHYATFSISFNETSKIRSSRRIHYHGQVCVCFYKLCCGFNKSDYNRNNKRLSHLTYSPKDHCKYLYFQLLFSLSQRK